MEIDIRTLLAKLNPECKRALEKAAVLCVGQTHYNVEVEHLLFKLLEASAPDALLIFREFGIQVDDIMAQLQQAMERFKRGNGRTPALSPHLAPLFQEAWLLSSMLLGEQQVRCGTLLLAALEVDSLRGSLIESAPGILKIPRASLRLGLADLLPPSAEDAGGPVPGPGTAALPPFANATGAGAANAPEVAGATPKDTGLAHMPTQRRGASAHPALDQFTVDLTALARQGKIDPIRGRDAEIRQIVDVLLRRRQNNPILTGEAGVGKTAVVEGFAQRIVQGTVPPALQKVVVRSLDLALLQAGAGIKGEFENRLKSVIAEVKASLVPIVLFIDEAHQLIGAGGAEGQGDAANLLKPALARGELRTIAATTWAEYKKYVERDPALARRFQVVKVDEPSEEVAIDMLRGMVKTLELHHGVEIVDEAVREAVKLSQRYISGRQLPDKAISVLDTACARVAIGQSGVPPEIESLNRDISSAENQLRILRHEALTGRDHRQAIGQLQQDLALRKRRRDTLGAKLEDERHAVQEIVALRRRIADSLDAPATTEDAENPDWMAATLNRLEKGLEAIQNDEPMIPVAVDSAVVAAVISGWTGIPVGRMLADELHTVLNLQEKMAERVVGQDQALDAIARRIRTSRADLDDPGKPVGVFLLIGPSGVGKTETACALADMMYGGDRNMVTVNMSEYQEAHTVSGLKGAPPGYVGYGRGGVLTEAVRRKPYSVVLLDEMEKAHPDVLELFFQVFDKGVMEDGEGVQIDFKNTVILLTSNAAQDVITDACSGSTWPDAEQLVERLRPVLLQQFSPAFLGRLAIIPYYPLGDAHIHAIVNLKLHKLAARFSTNHHTDFSWNPSVSRAIAARCTEVDSGARNVDHILSHSVLPELSRQVLERISMGHPFREVHMEVDAQGDFCFHFRPETLV